VAQQPSLHLRLTTRLSAASDLAVAETLPGYATWVVARLADKRVRTERERVRVPKRREEVRVERVPATSSP
jgi:hypothetical protein